MAVTPVLVRLPISHYCKKVEWALAHAGLPYETRDVWFRELLDLRDLHPEGTVPVLAAGGRRWCGSQQIMGWIDAQAPEAGLYPVPAAREWESWADAEIGPLARRDCYRTIYEHPTRYSRNPLLWVLLRAARPQVLGVLKHIKARRDYARDDEVRAGVLSRIGDRLRQEGTGFLFGHTPTAADFATAALLAPMLRLRRCEVNAHPDLHLLVQYLRRVRPRRSTRTRRRRLAPQERAAMAASPVAAGGPWDRPESARTDLA